MHTSATCHKPVHIRCHVGLNERRHVLAARKAINDATEAYQREMNVLQKEHKEARQATNHQHDAAMQALQQQLQEYKEVHQFDASSGLTFGA